MVGGNSSVYIYIYSSGSLTPFALINRSNSRREPGSRWNWPLKRCRGSLLDDIYIKCFESQFDPVVYCLIQISVL